MTGGIKCGAVFRFSYSDGCSFVGKRIIRRVNWIPNSLRFKVLTGVACLVGLTVPILGANPIYAQILTQVAAVFVLPLVIACILYLINQQELMGRHKAGFWLNLGLVAALIFACLVSYTGYLALSELI